MAIATQQYIRNPLYVDAIKVTEENFLEISFWCTGSIKNNDGTEVNEGTQINPESQHIQLQRVNNPKNQRQTQAHVGDWILKTDKGYKIYNDQAFRNSFTRVQGEAADAAVQAAKPQPTNQEDNMDQQDQQAQDLGANPEQPDVQPDPAVSEDVASDAEQPDPTEPGTASDAEPTQSGTPDPVQDPEPAPVGEVETELVREPTEPTQDAAQGD